MSDIDRMLEQAGENWRAAQPPAPEPDPTRWTTHHSRHWLAVAAAAAGVALLAGGIVVAERLNRPDQPPAAAPAILRPPDNGTAPDPADLVVHDGDTVQGTGEVIARPGRPVQFCTPDRAVIMPYPGPPPGCDGIAVELRGADTDRLASRSVTRDGIVQGWATIRGTYRAGVLQVTRQSPGLPAPDLSALPPDAPPCDPPPGGWEGDSGGDSLATAVSGYVNEHPDRFYGVRVAYPDGRPEPGTSFAPSRTVVVVGVSGGDPAQAQQELRSRFGPNICAVRVSFDRARQVQAEQAAAALLRDPRNHIVSTGGASGWGPIDIRLVMVTERLFQEFQRIGLDQLELHPFLRPVTPR